MLNIGERIGEKGSEKQIGFWGKGIPFQKILFLHGFLW
jgi:hypothetical protein